MILLQKKQIVLLNKEKIEDNIDAVKKFKIPQQFTF